MSVSRMPIPGYPAYFANYDGTITRPNGKLAKAGGKQLYARIRIKGKMEKVSRLQALAWKFNPRPDIFNVVDHIDGNKRNDCPWNLRWLTKQLNGLNTGARNCSFHKQSKKWHAAYRFNGKDVYLGYFETEAEAHRVGRTAREKCFETVYEKLRMGAIEL